MVKVVKTKIVTKEIIICDIEGCEQETVGLNSNIRYRFARDRIDLCLIHAQEKHVCEYITKYNMIPTYGDSYYVIQKKVGCLEENTICKGKSRIGEQFKKYLRTTYHLHSQEDWWEFIFRICEKNKWLMDGADDYGKTTLQYSEVDKNIAQEEFDKLMDYNRKEE